MAVLISLDNETRRIRFSIFSLCNTMITFFIPHLTSCLGHPPATEFRTSAITLGKVQAAGEQLSDQISRF